MREILKKVQVNIPFEMLYNTYLPRFIEEGINPEIGFDAQALENYAYADFTRIARELHERGLTITLHGPFVDLSPASPDPAVRALTRRRFEQFIQMVALFKPINVICHTGYDKKRYGYMLDSWVEKSTEMWSWLARRVVELGGRLLLENVYEHGPDEIRVLLEVLEGQGVRFCLDTGHQAAFGRTPLEVWAESLGPYIDQIHLHDNSGHEDEHLALGQGTIDFIGLFNRLKFIRESPPTVTLEPHKEADLWVSLEYLEKCWPW